MKILAQAYMKNYEQSLLTGGDVVVLIQLALSPEHRIAISLANCYMRLLAQLIALAAFQSTQ